MILGSSYALSFTFTVFQKNKYIFGRVELCLWAFVYFILFSLIYFYNQLSRIKQHQLWNVGRARINRLQLRLWPLVAADTEQNVFSAIQPQPESKPIIQTRPYSLLNYRGHHLWPVTYWSSSPVRSQGCWPTITLWTSWNLWPILVPITVITVLPSIGPDTGMTWNYTIITVHNNSCQWETLEWNTRWQQTYQLMFIVYDVLSMRTFPRTMDLRLHTMHTKQRENHVPKLKDYGMLGEKCSLVSWLST